MKASPPRPEYPRPVLARDEWQNLNGDWHFAMDPGDLGLQQQWQNRTEFEQSIVVPYPVEAEASQIGNREPDKVVWYWRSFHVNDQWQDKHVRLNIGACDYNSRVFINGAEVGQNQGGYAPFSFDISHAVSDDCNTIAIRVEDGLSWSQPRGKQAGTTRWPIDYDGVTGIWQTVWLEPVGSSFITDLHNSFSLADHELQLGIGLSTLFSGALEVDISYAGRQISHDTVSIDQRNETKVVLHLDQNAPLWCPASPKLCDVKLILKNNKGEELDRVQSYVGLREIKANEGKLTLNDEPLYIKGVLDQGYFPGGWYTALDDATLRQDVELTKAMGFNCVRKHQKAEDPRYLYWADRLGLLVWSEMPSGRIFSSQLVESLTTQWVRLVKRDRTHPCIIAWVPFNESWGVWNQLERPEQRAFVDALVHLTKSLDSSRLVVGNDGWEYSSGDLWTLHLYEGDSLSVQARLKKVLENPHSELSTGGRIGAFPDAEVSGLPVLLTECGGIGYQSASPHESAFAYGNIPATPKALEARIRRIAGNIKEATALCGFVWTQLTDVQQEINGLLTFDRVPKLKLETLRDIFSNIGPTQKVQKSQKS